jgi:hypothetical protein
MKRSKEDKLRATAYHEAGHAVAAHVLRMPIGITTVVPNAERGSLGHCEVRFPRWLELDGELTPAGRFWIERNAQVSFAGSEAERLFTGRYNHKGASSDYHSAVVPAGYLYEGELLEIYLKLHQRCARALVSSEMWKPCIEAVAKQLLEKQTLRPLDVRQVIAAVFKAKIEARRQ